MTTQYKKNTQAPDIGFFFFLKFYLLILERGGKGDGETERHRFVVPLIYIFFCCFLFVPWAETIPTTLGILGWCSNQLSYPARGRYWILSFFKRYYLFTYLFLERGEGRKWEKHQCVVASHSPLARDLAHSPSMCPDWESNWWPCGSQIGTQSTEPYQPGLSS